MVTTRSGRAATPSPGDSPQAATTTRKSGSGPSASRGGSGSSGPGGPRAWTHAPSRTTLLWLAVSLPLVIWDSGYVLLRPLTMEGGSLHWPLYTPYKLYGEVDHVYGWKAWEAKNGFTAAQGTLNVVETAMYLAYLYIYYTRGTEASRIPLAEGGELKGRTTLSGKPAALAVILAFSAAVMTLSKTVLYWLCEYWSGFDNIGHNTIQDLIPLWIIPNGAWLILPTYMIYVMGAEIIEGLTVASEGAAIVKKEE